jgi:hypothetical protein
MLMLLLLLLERRRRGGMLMVGYVLVLRLRVSSLRERHQLALDINTARPRRRTLSTVRRLMVARGNIGIRRMRALLLVISGMVRWRRNKRLRQRLHVIGQSRWRDKFCWLLGSDFARRS